jgi:hypothetical protein
MLPICTWNCCVPNEALSGLEKFEGLDPVVWCPRGYAIISVDSRGTGSGDGFISVSSNNFYSLWARKMQKTATMSSKLSQQYLGVTAKSAWLAIVRSKSFNGTSHPSDHRISPLLHHGRAQETSTASNSVEEACSACRTSTSSHTSSSRRITRLAVSKT